MGAAVTHGNENIVLLQGNGGFVNFFAANVQFALRVLVQFKIANHNHMRIIVLNNFGGGVVN